jgi:hypothetical protein
MLATPPRRRVPGGGRLGASVRFDVGLTTGVKLRGPEGAERLRATSASTAELCSILRPDNHVHLAVEHMKKTH